MNDVGHVVEDLSATCVMGTYEGAWVGTMMAVRQKEPPVCHVSPKCLPGY